MYILLIIHSFTRWIIVAVGGVVFIRLALGWARKDEFDKVDRGLTLAYSGLIDLQVSLGLLYFFITGFANDMYFPAFRIKHAVTMLIAAASGHAPSMFKEARNRYAVGVYSITATLMLIVIGVAFLPGGWSR